MLLELNRCGCWNLNLFKSILLILMKIDLIKLLLCSWWPKVSQLFFLFTSFIYWFRLTPVTAHHSSIFILHFVAEISFYLNFHYPKWKNKIFWEEKWAFWIEKRSLIGDSFNSIQYEVLIELATRRRPSDSIYLSRFNF